MRSAPRIPRQWMVGILFASMACVVPAPLHGQGDVSVETIFEIWQQRQAKVRSARFQWDDRRVYPKGSFTNSLPKALKKGLDEMTIPPKDYVFNVPGSLSFDGDKIRYTHEGHRWSVEKQDYLMDRYTSVFDGKVGKTLHHDLDTQHGSIHSPTEFDEARTITIAPITMAFRSVQAKTGFGDIREYTIQSQRAMIDGQSCVELRRPDPKTNSEVRLWVDPQKAYLVTRYQFFVKDNLRVTMTIRYQKDATVGWVPKSWDIIPLLHDGSLDDSQHATVGDYSINPEFSENEFTLPFPKGATVTDNRTNQRFIAKGDGSETESASLARRNRSLLIAILVLLATLLALTVRHIKRRRAVKPS